MMRTAVATCRECGQEFTEQVEGSYSYDASLHCRKALEAHERETGHKTGANLPAEYLKGHSDPYTAAVITVLECYWRALEAGEVLEPTEGMVFSLKPHWDTVEGREQFISGLDEQYTNELRKNAEHWTHRGFTKHPAFYRLPDRMRLALCQELEGVLVAYHA